MATRSTSSVWYAYPTILSRIVSTSTARVSPFDTSSSVASFCWFLSATDVDGGIMPTRVNPPGAVGGAPSAASAELESRIWICRTIVAPGGEATVSTRSTTGATYDVNLNGTFPKAIRSSTAAVAWSTLPPLMNVPLLEPRSRMRRSSPSAMISA